MTTNAVGTDIVTIENGTIIGGVDVRDAHHIGVVNNLCVGLSELPKWWQVRRVRRFLRTLRQAQPLTIRRPLLASERSATNTPTGPLDAGSSPPRDYRGV